MTPTQLRSHFILTCSTRSGFRQTMRFHLAHPIDFAGLHEDEKITLMQYAIESYGMAIEDLNPAARIEVMAFASETECQREYERVRGDKQGPAPRGMN